MVLMAIDHVRVYSGLPAGGPTAGIFFTRWVTHFVAPAFVFLAGTAAFLHGQRLANRAALARFLVGRGLWLVLLELTVIRVAWTFNLDFAHYMLAGVIWMIGWCMVLLAAAIALPVTAIAVVGVAIVALHNLTDVFGASQAFGETGPPPLLTVLYFGGGFPLWENGPPFLVLFVIVPWIGVMMTGYAFGRLVQLPAERWRLLSLGLGVALCLAFVVLRGLDVYGDPRPWHTSRLPGILAYLNTTKYPASLSFLLMTLGPMLVLLGLVHGLHGNTRLASALITFGRVPMFYYLLHIPVIHGAAMLVSLVHEGRVNPWLFGNHPMAPPPVPEGYAWSLALLYLVFALCVGVLYFPCRWFAEYRARKRSRWLSYV